MQQQQKKVKFGRLDLTIFEDGIGQHCLNLKWVEATMLLDSGQVRYLDYSVTNMGKPSPLMYEVTGHIHGSSLLPASFWVQALGFQ